MTPNKRPRPTPEEEGSELYPDAMERLARAIKTAARHGPISEDHQGAKRATSAKTPASSQLGNKGFDFAAQDASARSDAPRAWRRRSRCRVYRASAYSIRSISIGSGGAVTCAADCLERDVVFGFCGPTSPPIGQALACDAPGRLRHAHCIVNPKAGALVVTEIELGEVTVQVRFGNVMVRSDDSAL